MVGKDEQSVLQRIGGTSFSSHSLRRTCSNSDGSGFFGFCSFSSASLKYGVEVRLMLRVSSWLETMKTLNL